PSRRRRLSPPCPVTRKRIRVRFLRFSRVGNLDRNRRVLLRDLDATSLSLRYEKGEGRGDGENRHFHGRATMTDSGASQAPPRCASHRGAARSSLDEKVRRAPV